MYDWIDESISHNPSSLPKHCIDATGHLRKDLLRPASQMYHENMILSGHIECIQSLIEMKEEGPSSSLSKKVLSNFSSTSAFFHKYE